MQEHALLRFAHSGALGAQDRFAWLDAKVVRQLFLIQSQLLIAIFYKLQPTQKSCEHHKCPSSAALSGTSGAGGLRRPSSKWPNLQWQSQVHVCINGISSRNDMANSRRPLLPLRCKKASLRLTENLLSCRDASQQVPGNVLNSLMFSGCQRQVSKSMGAMSLQCPCLPQKQIKTKKATQLLD